MGAGRAGPRAARRGRGRPAASGRRGAGGGRSRAGVGGPASPAQPPGPARGRVRSVRPRRCSLGTRPAMEAERPPAPGPGCGRLPLRAAGRDPAAAPVSVPAPPQGPAVEFALPQEPEPRAADLGAPGAGAAGPPTPSAHIPVPGHRAPPGKARLDEVMAAAALTSLSTSPLLLGAPAVAFSTEPSLEPWREAPVRPPGSGGDGGWGPTSDQSSPSTPSPPLPPEAAHFLFGEPALRKRKSSLQGLFQCLWKRCGKVLSSASGMQRHIRLVHLGRQAEPEQSDGEEDFYYTELDVGVDSLTDGLSGLTPGSPTASVPPAFPHLEPLEPPALPSLLRPPALPPPPVLSSLPAPQGCLAPVHPEPQPIPVRACAPALPTKPGANPRKPRGDAKKCRKVYGMDHRDLWCTACRWKKACQRFLD
ncbi:LOW QUALITY PROTEIN: SLC2A4 regulator [Kogia breviceps]|uniref:LOW QUALITY PROTEIN: SLC2A4 regulator n=1 Tax=Kogia breviceps TaxID=27615 RepID=UPI0027954597|nr:LOW QUALITY PROTEIN: SLC2A4 regulator [Kogia breviceps]